MLLFYYYYYYYYIVLLIIVLMLMRIVNCNAGVRVMCDVDMYVYWCMEYCNIYLIYIYTYIYNIYL